MLPWIVAILVIGADILSKYWVDAHLPIMLTYPTYPYGGIPVFQNWGGIDFSISHLTNTGAAWGALSDYQGVLVIARIVLIIGLVAYTLFWNQHKSWQIPLSLIIAGAIGNVIDYYVYGHVVDMLHFVFWRHAFPVFNVADSAVSMGVIWLMLLTCMQSKGCGART